MGYLGVDFFFVLSGFIIMHAHMSDAPKLASVRRYVGKRLWRIYPPYLPITLALVVAYGLWPSLSEGGGREFGLLTSLFLLPSAQPPALSVAWTLVHEMQFYAVFLLFFVSARLFVAALLAWLLMIVLASSGVLELRSGAWRYLLSPLNIEFMFGVLAAWLYRRNLGFVKPMAILPMGLMFAVAGVALHGAGETGFAWRLIFAFGLMLTVLGTAALEKQRRVSWPGWMLTLGSASYSIYLIHNPLLSLTQRLAAGIGMGWISGLVFGVLCSVTVGVMYWWAVERPVLRWTKGRSRASTNGLVRISSV